MCILLTTWVWLSWDDPAWLTGHWNAIANCKSTAPNRSACTVTPKTYQSRRRWVALASCCRWKSLPRLIISPKAGQYHTGDLWLLLDVDDCMFIGKIYRHRKGPLCCVTVTDMVLSRRSTDKNKYMAQHWGKKKERRRKKKKEKEEEEREEEKKGGGRELMGWGWGVGGRVGGLRGLGVGGAGCRVKDGGRSCCVTLRASHKAGTRRDWASCLLHGVRTVYTTRHQSVQLRWGSESCCLSVCWFWFCPETLSAKKVRAKPELLSVTFLDYSTPPPPHPPTPTPTSSSLVYVCFSEEVTWVLVPTIDMQMRHSF